MNKKGMVVKNRKINIGLLVRIIILGQLSCNLSYAKVLIISAAYNRPDLIEIQQRCFKKFVLEEFEQVIFNDAEDPHFEKEIATECDRLGIRCIRVPQETVHENRQKGRAGWENGFNFRSKDGKRLHYRVNFREGEVIQYAFEQIGFNHNDIVVNIDLDAFPLRAVSFKEILDGHPIAGILWGNMPPYITTYPMPIFMVFDMPKLTHKKAINFNSGFIGSSWFDLCSLLQFYTYCHDIHVKNYYTLDHVHCWKIGKDYTEENLLEMGYDSTVIKFVQEYYKKLFVEINYFPLGDNKDHTLDIQAGKNGIYDQCQIIERHFFHFGACTNWMGSYDDFFMTAKTKFVKDFVFALT